MIQISKNIRGLVFDCDGTIADTMPLHYQAWAQALAEHGQDFPEAMFYEMAGIPTHRIIEILNEKHGYTLPAALAAERKDALFLELLPRVKPIEPVVRLVEMYSGKLPVAVATGGALALSSWARSRLGSLVH